MRCLDPFVATPCCFAQCSGLKSTNRTIGERVDAESFDGSSVNLLDLFFNSTIRTGILDQFVVSCPRIDCAKVIGTIVCAATSQLNQQFCHLPCQY
jgi:hypothetical protein